MDAGIAQRRQVVALRGVRSGVPDRRPLSAETGRSTPSIVAGGLLGRRGDGADQITTDTQPASSHVAGAMNPTKRYPVAGQTRGHVFPRVCWRMRCTRDARPPEYRLNRVPLSTGRDPDPGWILRLTTWIRGGSGD